MPKSIIPFETHGEGGPPGSSLSDDKLDQWLSEGLSEACQQHRHLRDYLRLIPIEKIGVPEYLARLSRNHGDKKNIVYPVSDEVFVHIYCDDSLSRGRYVAIEPDLTEDLSRVLPEAESALTRVAYQLYEAESNEEKIEALLKALDGVCEVGRGGPAPSKAKGKKNDKAQTKVQMTPEQFEALKYVIIRDKVGMGAIQPMLNDPNIEDISESGLGPIFVEHKIFDSLESSIVFETVEDLDQFVLRMSEAIGKPVTMRNPVVDASLLDGSRINIVFGNEISRRGSSFSIRKFFDTPLSILELVGFGSISYEMAAYLSLMIENHMNMFVVGETASGKTTLMNAITTFIPLHNKIVSIEDTPELQVPHDNWVREVGKAVGGEEEGAQVTMFDLLKAALRQRPDFIIIGEIRGAEGAIAFGAMQTGHAVMSTFHAASVEKVIQRLTGHPINIPRTYVDSLNIVVCQNAVKLPNGKQGRRATSISEIVGYDPVDEAFSFVEVFQWKQAVDEFEFIGNKNSYTLEEKIAPKYGYPADKKWKIYTLLEKRARILERLHKEKGVTDFYELLRVLARAQHEGLF
jgi:flagellar protein FlaI